MKDYTLESIEERLSGMVKDLPGCDYYSAGISKRHLSGNPYYAVDLAFRVKGLMRAVTETNGSKEWAVENAFISLNTIVEGIKAKPALPKRLPASVGRPRKGTDTQNSLAA